MIASCRNPALRRPSPPNAGFTLIEVLAAVFLTSIVIAAALAFFVGLSASTEAAAAKTQHGRHAVAVLDRIARDLEGAYLLVKRPEDDPLTHPWWFIAESSASMDGADRLMFTSRNYRPRSLIGHGSDLGVVTYMLRASEDGVGYELVRSISPGLPEPGEHEFPSTDDERLMVVAIGLSEFAMRFSGEDGEWQQSWDSSQLVDSGALPVAAEIELAFAPADPQRDARRRLDDVTFDGGTFDGGTAQTESFMRRVTLPMRPVDLAAMLDGAAAAAEAEAVEDDEDDEYGEGDGEEDGAEGARVGPNDPSAGRGALDPGRPGAERGDPEEEGILHR